MSQQTVNPYPILGAQYSAGLDTVITNLPAATIDDLVRTVRTYILGLNYFSNGDYNIVQEEYTPSIAETALEAEIDSVAYSAINSYNNKMCYSLYNGTQLYFVNMLIGPSFINRLTVDTLKDRILNVEDNLTMSGISVEQQTPLLFATMIGESSYDYFINVINSPPDPNPWETYFNSAKISPIANLPFWDAAAMEGALISARSTRKGMIAPTVDIVTVEMVSALIAALTINVGKILFKWAPRIQNKIAMP